MTDPVTPVVAAKTVETVAGLTWPVFSTIVGTVVTVLGFLAGLFWKIWETRKAEKKAELDDKKDNVEIESLKESQGNLEDLVQKLQEDYNALKTEIAILKTKDEATNKDIERLESNIDRIIDMLMRAFSEEKL